MTSFRHAKATVGAAYSITPTHQARLRRVHFSSSLSIPHLSRLLKYVNVQDQRLQRVSKHDLWIFAAFGLVITGPESNFPLPSFSQLYTEICWKGWMEAKTHPHTYSHTHLHTHTRSRDAFDKKTESMKRGQRKCTLACARESLLLEFLTPGCVIIVRDNFRVKLLFFSFLCT